MSLPVSIPIEVDTGGAITILHDPRRRECVSLTRVDSLTEPVDWETKIAKMVETALARALPAALGAPARLPDSPLSAPTLQSGLQIAPPARQPGPGPSHTANDDDTAQTSHRRSLPVSLARLAQDPAVGVRRHVEGAVAASARRSLLPLAGSPHLGRSRRRDRAEPHERSDRRHDRRTITVGRSRTASSVLPPASTVTTSVPAVGHVISTDDGHKVDDRTIRMKLPPPLHIC